MIRILFLLLLLIINLQYPFRAIASSSTDPSVLGLQNRISNNFSKKYCKSIEIGFSKDEAMRSAIIDTENIVAFSLNPQKRWIAKEDLAKQISINIINNCGWSLGLTGKQGIDYFQKYFLEINEKITPNKKLSG